MIAIENNNLEDLIFNQNELVYATHTHAPCVAKFEKVPYVQFKEDVLNLNITQDQNRIEKEYDAIKLPKRSTAGSAGYDFVLPHAVTLRPDRGIVVPTGIRARIMSGWMLKLYPRSGTGFKYGVEFYNTTPIIDSDYYFAKNTGHIMLKLTVKEGIHTFEAGERICQGIFEQFGLAIGDDATDIRTGGLGSTGKK